MTLVDHDRLTRDGYAPIARTMPPDLLDEFERTMDRLAESGLRRKGLAPDGKEPMHALLSAGGAYRRRLFPSLKNLAVVQEMTACARGWVEESGFLDWARIETPAIWPSLRADPPDETKYLLPWHQDYATACARAWRLWIPLRRVSVETGSMAVLPGTHKLGHIEHEAADLAAPTVPETVVNGATPAVMEAEAGCGVVIHPLIVHRSVPAQTNVMKYVLMVQVHDLSTLSDEDDPNDELAPRLALAQARDAARG